MFDKFGEFDSVEELNRAAAAQKAEGDEEALVLLAQENGIDKEDAEDYMDGAVDELATPIMAAVGKLDVEKADLKIEGTLEDWVNEIVGMCADSEELSRAVRSKGKDLAGYIALTAEEGYKHRAVVDKRIVQKMPTVKGIIGDHEFVIGIPDKLTRKHLIEEYYLGRKNG